MTFWNIFASLRAEKAQVGQPLKHHWQASLNTEMDSLPKDDSWVSQVDGQSDSILDFTTPLDVTSPLEGYQPGSHPTSATLTGPNHQLNSISNLTGPVVQTYQIPANLPQVPQVPQMPFSPYVIPSGPSQLPGLPTLHPTVILCRLCGQVTGTVAVTTVPPIVFNGNYNLLPTLDGRRQW